MTIDVVAAPSGGFKGETARAFAAGLERHGVACRLLHDHREVSAETVACWSWRRGRQHIAHNRRVIVLERGYVGDRQGEWVSIGWDGLNGRARFPIVDDGGQRWRRHFDGALRQPRQARDGYLLILGQRTGDTALLGAPADWYALCAARARALGLEAVFRRHPQDGGPAWGEIPTLAGDLQQALGGAALALAWNSNSLTDAVLAGVPVLAGEPGAMAWPVAGRGLTGDPHVAWLRLGQRESWADRLAWCQWRMPEIASGAAWDAVGPARANAPWHGEAA